MKIRVLSDLHLEFEPFRMNPGNADLIVLAGDVDIKGRGLKWIQENLRDKQVIYVPGNHEYYGKALPQLTYKFKKEAERSSIHILEKDVLTIGGINFFGCTLWTDFSLFGDPKGDGFHCHQRVTDYRKIRVSPKYSKLRSIDVFRFHQITIEWLNRKLETHAGEMNVVISHHGPSPLSLPKDRRNDALSAAYVSDLTRLIERHAPKLWIHGHIHASSDYYIGGCRVICNPRGYPDEPNEQFDPNFVIDL